MSGRRSTIVAQVWKDPNPRQLPGKYTAVPWQSTFLSWRWARPLLGIKFKNAWAAAAKFAELVALFYSGMISIALIEG